MSPSCSSARTRTSTGQRTPDETAWSSTEPRVAVLGPPRGASAPAAAALLSGYGLLLEPVAPGDAIPGSYWGEPEAGLVDSRVHAREDTPLHSLLHEACHAICMDPARRACLHTDAGGDPLEECAVCYLSILLSDRLPAFGRARMLADMDAWGYSFRLGSARAWFEHDAGDALAWLAERGLVDSRGAPTGRRCGDAAP